MAAAQQQVVLSPEEQARREWLANDILSTGELDAAPKRGPEAHKGVITGVNLNRNDNSGKTSLLISAQSDHTAQDYKFYLPLPPEFVANVNIKPSQMSVGTTNATTGKTEGNQREQYNRNIGNSDGNATAQRLRWIAAQSGKVAPPGAPNPTNIDEWGMLHSYILTGARVIFTLECDRNPSDPQFANVLRLKNFFAEREILGNAKSLPKYKKMWEKQ